MLETRCTVRSHTAEMSSKDANQRSDNEREDDMFQMSMSIDPDASLSILSGVQLKEVRDNYLEREQERSTDEEEEAAKEEEEEDKIDDLPLHMRKKWGIRGEDSESNDDSGKEYKYGLPGTTPPKSATSRAKKKAKHKTGKNLSCESRVVMSTKSTKHELRKRPHSMVNIPHDVPSQDDPSDLSGEPGFKQSRRHTVHDVKMEQAKAMTKKERRQLQRSLSPQQSNEDGTPKSSKKHKKMQRKKDRDEKTDLQQQNMNSGPSSLVVSEITRAVSISGDGTMEARHTGSKSFIDYPSVPQRAVTESLNPALYRRGSEFNVHADSWGRVRRTNSDAQLTLGFLNGSTHEKRCAPERKQFYRQFIKSIKYFGINSTATNRMEPAPPSRFHSENLGASNPFSPAMDKIWIELQAFLRDCTTEEHEEWLFFNQRNVDYVLTKIIDFRFIGFGEMHSIGTITSFSREGYEPIRSTSTPAMGSQRREDTSASSGRAVNMAAGVHDDVVSAGHNMGLEGNRTAPPKQVVSDEPVGSTGNQESDERVADSTHHHHQEIPGLHCKVDHPNYLSSQQRKALREVGEILKQLDEVESLYMNRKKMGHEHGKYRTLFFRRHACGLILWHKVTQGLSETLCRLSNWLGKAIALPNVCHDPPPAPSETSSNPVSPSTIRRADSSEGIVFDIHKDPPKSPLVQSIRQPLFSICSSLAEDKESLDHFASSSLTSSTKPQATTAQISTSPTRPTGILRKTHSLQSSFEYQPYRDFVNTALKRIGIHTTMKRLKDFINPTLRLAKYALSTTRSKEETDLYEEFSDEERKPLLPGAKKFMHPALFSRFNEETHEMPPHLFERSASVGPQNWMEEFQSMNLPSFSLQYIQLFHVPLDVMHECLRLQAELGTELSCPSPHSIKQLVDECREALEHAIDVRIFYRENMESILLNYPAKTEQVESDMEAFESDLKKVLRVYFGYLKTWVNVSSGHILEEEWRKVKTICTSIRGGEAEAGRKFCDMVTQLLETMGDDLDNRMDECCSAIINNNSEMDSKEMLNQSCRKFKELFVGIRERANRVLGFAKILRKDLEIAADFRITTSIPEMLGILKASDHVQVVLPHQKLGKMIFVPEGASENPSEIQQLLNVSFAHGGHEDFSLKESYILLVNTNVLESQSAWSGQTINIEASTETAINLSELQVDSLKMVVGNSAHLNECRNSFLRAVGKAVTLTNERTSSHENVAERIQDLKMAACELAKRLMRTASKVMEYLTTDDITLVEDHSSSYQSTMHACFNLGFEYVREVFRLLGDDMAYRELGEQSLEYAIVWIHFVLDKCDRGRGTRPRWASTGLEFMIVACAPTTLAAISQSRFENIKKLMNRCVDHVIGEAPPPPTTMRADDTLSRMSLRNKKSWVKPKKLPFGAMGFSFTGLSDQAHLEDYEDTTSVYKLPETKFREKISKPSFNLGLFHVDQPPEVANYDPSRMETVVHIHGTESTDYESPSGRTSLYQRQQSPLSTILSKSPPTSTESLSYNSSGVDSPLNQSTSDLTTASYTPSYPPAQRYNPMLSTTPINMERMDSTASSVGSASQYYRSPSILSPLSRSDSTGSSNGMDKVKRIQDKITVLEINREKELRNKKLIGCVRKQQTSLRAVANLSNLKQANFKWQRGRKLGEGSFGKVYECLNLTTGEINAVKQISIQDKDTSAIQTIIDEISNFQTLRNDYVVKFYGAEVHHNELYMFMEFCNEGTLWTIAQQGLTEEMMRHYTRDILKAVDAMHNRGIVHRDIKGANIFLSSNGSIKLGDFGLSVRLNVTMANHEIKQQAGTVPYMAPEVILKRDMGRPMDIWSVGCVVIEMATGKLPWAEFDNQFTIMYQLGSGKRPPIPRSVLSEEGHHFLDKCFIVDVQRRASALDLCSEPFVMVSDT